MTWFSKAAAAALGVMAFVTASASAAPLTFFGEDLGQGETVRLPSHPKADAARASFLANLTGVVTQGFENFADGAMPPLQVDFGPAGTATIQGNGFVTRAVTGTDTKGRYPISGSQFFQSGDVFSIVFAKPQVAFGFYGIDVGDFAGQLTVTYVDGTRHVLTIPHTVNGMGGSVIYFGFIDEASPFTGISFGDTAPGVDVFGFDDFTIGAVGQPTPPPNGTVSGVSGTVQAIVEGSVIPIGAGASLAKGIELSTGANGQVQASCGNAGNSFSLGANASVFLGASVCDPASAGSIDVTQGQFQVRFQAPAPSARRGVGSGMTVRTPVSMATPASNDATFSTLYTQTGNTGTALTSVQSGSVTLTDPGTGNNTLASAGSLVPLSGQLPAVVAAVLPSSRSVQLGVPATAFATILNAGRTPAIVCKIAPLAPFSTVPFRFAATEPGTNQIVGGLSAPVTIAPGVAQSFVFDMSPDSAILPGADIQLSLGCAGTSAPVVIGLNTLLLSASPTPVPDIIALALTPTPGLILDIPRSTNINAFVVATSNNGASGTLTVSADTGSASLPLTITVCQTTAGQCLAPPAPSVTTTIGAGQQPTFSVFVTATGTVNFNPALNRVFVRFKDGAVTRGSSSVAVRTE